MAEHFKAIHTYSDPGLDKQNIYQHELSIRMHSDGFSYCILDSKTNKFLHIEAYDLAGPGKKAYIPGDEENTDISKLSGLLESDLKWLCQPFAKTHILYEQGKATLIPEALFVEEEKKAVFEFNVASDQAVSGEIRNDWLSSVKANNMYALPAGIERLIEKFFPEAGIFHHSSALIQSLIQNYRNTDTSESLFVNTAASHIDLLRIGDKKLEYYNSFRYNTAEDFMYYLVFVVEQLGLNPESVDVVLLGEVERHSPLADLIRKYIRNVQYAERNASFGYSFVFDQLPGHYYYNLLNASSCE